MVLGLAVDLEPAVLPYGLNNTPFSPSSLFSDPYYTQTRPEGDAAGQGQAENAQDVAANPASADAKDVAD